MKRLTAAMMLGAPAFLTLPGCMTTAASVTGSEIGGTIPMAGITRQQAADMAKNHCARYGRSSHLLAVRAQDSMDSTKAIFECVS